MIKCNSCKIKKLKTCFKIHKGNRLKGCNKCLLKSKLQRDKNKCEHRRRKSDCRNCGNELHKLIMGIIKHSKEADKKHNRYDLTNFIDYDFVESLIDDSKNKCCYCLCEMQLINYEGNLATIERIDNSKGHIRGNCLIACITCNLSKKGSRVNTCYKKDNGKKCYACAFGLIKIPPQTSNNNDF